MSRCHKIKIHKASLLHLKLEPTFTSKPPASADSAKLFRLSSTLVSTYEDAIDFLSSQQVGVFQAQVAALRAQSAAMQAKGGISIGIELLACGTIVHLMPDGHPGL